MIVSPICLFVYKRLVETTKTIEALKKNSLARESVLFIFSDGPRTIADFDQVNEVRSYISEVDGFRDVVISYSEVNQGLARSIISGVSYVLNSHDRVIVLEDDLISSPNFLSFMNDSLQSYINRDDIQSINGYSPLVPNLDSLNSDVYLHYRTFSWGWATWSKYWHPTIFSISEDDAVLNSSIYLEFDKKCGNDMANMLKSALNKKIDSWYVFWAFDHFINNRFAVYPFLSKIDNIGYGIDSTHCEGVLSVVSKFDNSLHSSFSLPENIKVMPSVVADFNNYFTAKYKIIFRLKMLTNYRNFKILFDEAVRRLSR